MKLIKKDPSIMKEFDRSYYKVTKNQEILEEFLNSDMKIAEIEDFTQKSAMCCAASLNNSIKRYRYNSLHAFSRNGHIYLIKTNEI